MKFTVRPLTPDLWPALEDLFGEKGACGGCWCMYWRIGSAYQKRPREENKAASCEIVRRGPAPGLVAFGGPAAVGWCQLTPRDSLPWLDRAWRLKRVDDVPVWSISCFYVRIGYRRKGVTPALRTPNSPSMNRPERLVSAAISLIAVVFALVGMMQSPALASKVGSVDLTPGHLTLAWDERTGGAYAFIFGSIDGARVSATCPAP